MSAQYNLNFTEIDKRDLALVGGKGANLGEMTKAGFPVPAGFAVTTLSYDEFLKQNKLADDLEAILGKTDVNDARALESASKRLQKKLVNAKFPAEVGKDVINYYKKLSGKEGNASVAVRSSATAEDLPGMSFAGQQATFLNIKGDTNLLVAVRECWASLFTARAIFYRTQNKIAHSKVKISVIVQKMVQSEVSGVMFTVDPVTSDKDRIIIEAVWGLGELIVQGSVTPDTYTVQKETFAILSKDISEQTVMLTKVGLKTNERKVPAKISAKQKLSDDEITQLAKIGQKLQEHYYFPQDVEWAKEGKSLFIVQTRPVTTIGKGLISKGVNKSDEVVPILTGAGASPGIATGEVNVVTGPNQIHKVVEGDILVAKMTSPDYVPAMKRASAIVTDEGGQTSHAAIVSRELGIPAVVGTKKATKLLKDGNVVTVDGAKGTVYAGGNLPKTATVKQIEEEVKTKTKTRVYVNLGEPEMVRKVAGKKVDGVGLLRAEFMIANIGIHPKESIRQKKQHIFIDRLTKDLITFCEAFNPRPVVYRATDFKTNEYRALPGGKSWEPEEPNPMLGFRGARRYITHPDVFNLELKAIAAVRKKYKNLWLMIPFVRSPEELAKVRKVVANEGFFEDTSFKFWMMVELPINVILIEDFIKVGIDGVSIGSNDLTMLVTGTDRDNSEVSAAFDERSKAMYWSLRRVIKNCNKHGVTSSICGQAPSTYDDLVEKLVGYGITSISVNPDAINRVRGVIAQKEKELIS